MIRVVVKENESIDKALKRFKKKLEKTRVLKDYRSRKFFTKPSVERRKEILKAAFKESKQNA
ncbi:MAG: 30S ribosomal protein S21 [Bacteroidetes bacterium]|nr:30S ribosomal protein S21 [Bacteroidota bacterium]